MVKAQVTNADHLKDGINKYYEELMKFNRSMTLGFKFQLLPMMKVF
jgi:hypothetical protein